MRTILYSVGSMWVAAVVWAQPGAPVAVPNPGFEDGELLPKGWIVWSSDSDDDHDKALHRATEADFIWDQAVFHSGHRSLCIWNDGPRWATWRTETPVTVQAGRAYRLSVWIKRRGGASSTYLRVRNAGWTVCDEVSPGPEWQRFVLEFKTGPAIDRVNIELSDLGGSDTETWFDDLELVEVPNK